MSNYKEPQDKTAAYLSRDGKWFKMDKESVRRICGRPRLRNTAKLAFFGLQPYFHDGDGLLLHPLEHVSQELGSTKAKLVEDIDILVEIGFLRRTTAGLLYDPVSYKLITKKEEPADAEFCKFSQDSAKFGENLHSSLGQNAALDKIRASFSDASYAASEKRSDSSIIIKNEEDRKKGEGSLGLPSLFPGLKLKEIEEVRQANPDLDWTDVCSEFVRVNQEKKTPASKVNRQWFERFVAGYRNRKQQGAATASPGPVSPGPASPSISKPKKTLPKLTISEKEEWIIGQKKITQLGWGDIKDFETDMRAMPRLSLSDAIAYVRNLVDAKFEWDVEDALTNEDSWCYFFHWFNNDEVAGDDVWMDYENEAEKADRNKLEDEKAKAELLKIEEETKGSRPFRASYLRNLNGKTIQELLSTYKGNGWPTHIEIIKADLKEAEEKQYIVFNDDRTKIYGTEVKKKGEAAIS